jgi:uncharacterized integral membrane protein
MSTDRYDRSDTGVPKQSMDTGTKIKLGLLAVVGALIVVFALSNTDDSQVEYLVGDAEMPLILVIVISFVAGMIVGQLASMVSRFRRDD